MLKIGENGGFSCNSLRNRVLGLARVETFDRTVHEERKYL